MPAHICYCSAGKVETGGSLGLLACQHFLNVRHRFKHRSPQIRWAIEEDLGHQYLAIKRICTYMHNTHMRHVAETDNERWRERQVNCTHHIARNEHCVGCHYGKWYEVSKLLREINDNTSFMFLKVTIHNRLINLLEPVVRQHMRTRVYRMEKFSHFMTWVPSGRDRKSRAIEAHVLMALW